MADYTAEGDDIFGYRLKVLILKVSVFFDSFALKNKTFAFIVIFKGSLY